MNKGHIKLLHEMKREFMTKGAMPAKVPDMNFEAVFRSIAEQMIINFCNVIEQSYPDGDYPIADYETNEGDFGVQIALISEDFNTDWVILRRTINGYVIMAMTNGDSDGGFDFEFEEDDSLAKHITPGIVSALEMAL